ncbi:MAG TPA: pilus assembly protein PilM [Tepidisphaeraceae bacterium]|nr:pilus assembly protein PilM [Tepidisphaeraceae bacterium]
MLGFVQNWFAPRWFTQRCNPIGVDFGTDCLRLAQVQWVGSSASGEHKLVAAASADVPSHLRTDPAARLTFFTETVRDLLAQGDFRGRAAVLGLPAAWMHIQHLRMPKLDEESLTKALVFESRGKLPIDPGSALMRHLVAGEAHCGVNGSADQEPKLEVIVMAAKRELVNQYLAAAARARLDVIGMNVEPKAILDCFSFVHRRKADAQTTQCFVDIGCGATRAIITRGSEILFARAIPVGGDHFNRSVAQALKLTPDDARLLRIKLCHQQPALDERREKQEVRDPSPAAPPAARIVSPAAAAPLNESENSFALLSAGMAASSRRQEIGIPETAERDLSRGSGPNGKINPAGAPAMPASTLEAPAFARLNSPQAAPVPASAETLQARAVEQACLEPLGKLVEELDLCRRYYEATFPSKPVERLIFVGGEARQRTLCQHIARGLGLAAQVGDPMVRMGRVSDIGVESGLDRRHPQPTWAVAIGLSMGPANEVTR